MIKGRDSNPLQTHGNSNRRIQADKVPYSYNINTRIEQNPKADRIKFFKADKKKKLLFKHK